jgi:hypothetical protein
MLFPQQKTIVIFCEESGAFSNLYREAGYNVIVRDLQIDPSHDIRFEEYIGGGIYGFLGFPPCTDLSGSGARWWEAKGPEKLASALALADSCLRMVALYQHTLSFWAIENPVGRLSRYYGKPQFTFNPNEYAGYADDPEKEAYTKRTCLWGRFRIPMKKPIEATLGSMMHKLPPSEDRAILRSKTPEGFARAFFKYNQ